MKDVAEVRKQCHLFIDAMTDNRPNCDDAGVARRILEELERYGSITSTTRNRLFRWCDTNGTLYQRGVPIAQEICRGLYGKCWAEMTCRPQSDLPKQTGDFTRYGPGFRPARYRQS
jgi:hypothetical protein